MKKKRDNKLNYLKKLSFVLIKLAPEYGIAKAGVFGSITSGSFGRSSDVDVLVKFRVSPGFIMFMRLENELSRVLHRRVDLVTESSLSPYIRDDVLRELVVIYEEK